VAFEKRRKILVLDGHSLAHRAYHALPPTLTRADGTPTNAVLGFCNMVVKLLEQEEPDAVICAFDRAAPTFRHQEFEAYKAQRKPMDDALRVQMPIVREAAEAFGFSVCEIDGWEADDVIGTVARLAEESGNEAVIVTGDRDALQLVSDKVHVLLTRRGITEFEEYDPRAVREKYGFGPELIPDLKGLMGDTSDNIPGVPGVGEKTALRLVGELGTVEDILGKVHSIPQERLKNALLENAEVALQSKRLATIDRNAPIQLDLDRCCAPRQDPDRLASFLRKQDFRMLLARLARKAGEATKAGEAPEAATAAGTATPQAEAEGAQGSTAGTLFQVSGEAKAPEGLEIITSGTRLQEVVQALPVRGGRLAFDVVSTGAGAMTRRVVGLALEAEGVRVYVAVGEGECQVPLPAVIGLLRSVLEDPRVDKVCHDGKEKMILLARAGVRLSGISFDSMIASYLCDPSAPNGEICDVARRWVGVELPAVRGFVDTESRRLKDPGACPSPSDVAPRAAACLLSMDQVEARLLATISALGMERLYREVEMPLVQVLADMEMTGVKVDAARLAELSADMDGRLAALTQDIYRMAGEEFNINSTKQLGVVLFEKLGLPPLKKTKTGYSTDAEVLESLADKHPIVQKILEHRSLAKLKSTYADALPGMVNPETGRVHTTFNQTVTATGRLSSTDPNLQNIPVRTEEGRKIREVFVPGTPGWVIVTADYSQIELRVLAHISQDPVLIQSFLADEDIHRRTAAEVFGVGFDEVTPEMRSRAKAVNFGIVYGISDYGLAKNIGVTPAEAKRFIDRYFSRYRGVRNYMDSIIAQAKADGYVTTLLNRRRYLPELVSPSMAVRKFAERVAMNTPIQGTAADIIKKAMVSVHSRLAAEGLAARLLLQVHDELVLECPAEEVPDLTQLVRSEMEGAVRLAVPLKVDVSSGASWKDAK
jgi:DNA polymerase-1